MKTTKLNIKEWAEEDRPREKLLLKGVGALSDTELLAILLRSGSRDETAVELAQRLLQAADYNIGRMSKFSVQYMIANFKGVGEAKAISIVAALELGKRRKVEDATARNKMDNSKAIYDYFYPFLCDLPHEEFWAMFLNVTLRCISRIKIGQGGVTSTNVDLKLLYKEAVNNLSVGVVVCHNHPSGDPAPSKEDAKITRHIKEGLTTLGIQLIDHVIICDGKYYSFADEENII